MQKRISLLGAVLLGIYQLLNELQIWKILGYVLLLVHLLVVL